MYGWGNARFHSTPQHFSTRTVSDDRVVLTQMAVGGRAAMEAPPMSGVFLVRVRDGRQHCRVGGRERWFHAGEAFAAPPEREFTAETVDVSDDILFVHRDRVELIAQQTLGLGLRRDAFSELLTAPADRVRPVARLWGQLMTVLTSSDLHRNPLLYEESQQALLLALIEVFDVLEPAKPRRGPAATVSRATEFMRSRLTEPMTIEDIAGDLGISVRALHDGFRTAGETIPMHTLRLLRLEAARAELLEAGPASGLTVAEIARRWGFAHLGRFSQRYAEQFGEPPSRTLRR